MLARLIFLSGFLFANISAAALLEGNLMYRLENGELRRLSKSVDVNSQSCVGGHKNPCQVWVEKALYDDTKIKVRYVVAQNIEAKESIISVALWIDGDLVHSTGHAIEELSDLKKAFRQVHHHNINNGQSLALGLNWYP